MAKAFVLIGHRHWGKSRTLRALTGGRLTRRDRIAGRTFRIRRTSNDDLPSEFEDFVCSLQPATDPFVIVPMCPNFGGVQPAAESSLQELVGKYQVFVWVLRQAYGGGRQINQQEIAELTRFGTVGIDQHSDQEDLQRAAAFEVFIAANV